MSSPDSKQILASQLREVVSLYLVRQRRYAHEQGLSQTDRLLMLLHRHGPTTQSDFSRLAGLDKSWISRIVERYMEDGLVERQPLESDRRCFELHLTPAGVQQASAYDRVLTTHAEAFFATIPAEAHSDLENALEVIVTALHAQLEMEA